MTRDLIIFDIDGTLADISARKHLLDESPVPWDHFFALSYADAPIQPMCDLFRMYRELRPGNCVVGCLTARPARWQNITQQWLRREGCDPDMLFMRADDDHRPSPVVKAERADALIKAGWTIKLAFDDHDEIITMWRERGITALHVGNSTEED